MAPNNGALVRALAGQKYHVVVGEKKCGVMMWRQNVVGLEFLWQKMVCALCIVIGQRLC